MGVGVHDRTLVFQSAPRERGESSECVQGFRNSHMVSIRAPRAGRKRISLLTSLLRVVSIRAPRAGRKGLPRVAWESRVCFNPRPASGAKELQVYSQSIQLPVSIRAPRAGRKASAGRHWPETL